MTANASPPDTAQGSGFEGKPEYAAIFAATFKDLPVIREIEQRWKEQGMEADEPNRAQLQGLAIFDRRMEIIAGAIIYEFRAQTKSFAEAAEKYDDLFTALRDCQSEVSELRANLDRFPQAAANVLTAQESLRTVLDENTVQTSNSTKQLDESVRLCRERSAVVVALGVFSLLLAVAFGSAITAGLGFYFWWRQPPIPAHSARPAQAAPRPAPNSQPRPNAFSAWDQRSP